LFLLAGAYALGARSAGAQNARDSAGHYAIVIGTDDGFLRAFLVDEVTGESWQWRTMAWTDAGGKKQTLSYWDETVRGAEEAIRVAKELGAE